MEGKDIYEHWNQLNDHSLKGFSYAVKEGNMVVMEYLEMAGNSDGIYLSATVMNQNGGNPVSFKLIQSDSAFVFENPNHDFPKKIVYKKLNDSEVHVRISDGQQKGFAYTMSKQRPATPEEINSSGSRPVYDAALAKKLGADDYGMKSYFFVILKTGSN